MTTNFYRKLYLFILSLPCFIVQAQQPFERAVLIESNLQGDSIQLKWNEDLSATKYTIFKRPLEDKDWGAPIATLPPSAVSFTDHLAFGDAQSYAIFKSDPLPYFDTIQANADDYSITLEDQFAKGLCCNFGIGYFLLKDGNDTLVFANDFESLYTSTFSLDQDAELLIEIQPDLFGNHLGWELNQLSNDSIISQFGPLGTYLRKAPSLGMISVGNKYNGPLDQSSVLILVASNIYSDLDNELEVMKSDLLAEGKHAAILEVPLESNVEEVKTLIVTQHGNLNNLSTLFIIGHVAVPYSGDMYPDTHSEHHKGAWAADPFYADLDGIFTDSLVNETSAFFDKTKNIPGDGKYDQSLMPSELELIISRADFSDLPGLSADELTLTKRYLNKVHEWKIGKVNAIPQGLVDDNFGRAFGAPASNGYRNLASLLGPSQVADKDFLTALTDSSHLWAYGCGSGTTFSSEGVATTLDFETDSLQAIFLMTFGSNFGDWDHENNFLRSPLASGTVLNNAWVGNPHWFMHQMGIGVPIGKVALKNMNSHYLPGPQLMHMALMGDPTVTQYPVGSIDSLSISYDNDGPLLEWSLDTSKSYQRYELYHRMDSVSTWEFVTNIDGADSTFLHKDAAEGINYYFLFPEKLINNNSGCFYQKGMGIQDTVHFSLTSSLSEYSTESFNILPNPTRDLVQLTNISNKQKVVVYNENGQIICNIDLKGQSSLEINTSEWQRGVYFVKVDEDVKRLVKI